jgi:rare lipoprotein A (peptidoglycan hydrolase)
MGCALPFFMSNGIAVPECFGSPIPTMPYKTTNVEVYANGKIVTIPVIDCGPDLKENRPIDLTVAAFLALGGDLKVGLIPVTFRILGAAKYLVP